MWYRKEQGKRKARRQLEQRRYYMERNARDYPQLYGNDLDEDWPRVAGMIAETRTGRMSIAEASRLDGWSRKILDEIPYELID